MSPWVPESSSFGLSGHIAFEPIHPLPVERGTSLPVPLRAALFRLSLCQTIHVCHTHACILNRGDSAGPKNSGRPAAKLSTWSSPFASCSEPVVAVKILLANGHTEKRTLSRRFGYTFEKRREILLMCKLPFGRRFEELQAANTGRRIFLAKFGKG